MGDDAGPSVERPSSPETLAIARRLAHTEARVIGLLPASKTPVDVSQLATDLACALRHFVTGQIAVVGAWSTWDGRAGGAVVPAPERSRIVHVVPPSCANTALATVALEQALANHRSQFPRVVVDLAAYAELGELPAVVEAIDGVIFLAHTRKTLKRRLRWLTESVPPERNLGTILVD
jgi:hypothetical protein